MKKVPLAPKRVKLLNHHDGILDYGQNEKEEDKAYDIIKKVGKANNNEKEKENNNMEKNEKVYTNKIEKEKKTKIKRKKGIAEPKQKQTTTEIHSCIS